MQGAQIVVMGEKVYMGGGYEATLGDGDRVFLYDKTDDKWSDIPHTVKQFGLAIYKGRLITVGGVELESTSLTGEVFTLRADSRRWEKLIPPMPTTRHSLSVITTATSIVAAGGGTNAFVTMMVNAIANVEVYSDNTSQWYTAEPLPAPHVSISSVVIDDFCFLMKGNKCYRASLSSLIQRATSPTPSSATSSESLWKTLPRTPLTYCSVVCLNGSLLTVGGAGVGASSAVYILLDYQWVKLVNADLPAARMYCGTAQLSSNEIIVVGGSARLGLRRLKDVYIGTLLKD